MTGVMAVLAGSGGKTLKVTASNVSGSASGFAASGSVTTIVAVPILPPQAVLHHILTRGRLLAALVAIRRI